MEPTRSWWRPVARTYAVSPDATNRRGSKSGAAADASAASSGRRTARPTPSTRCSTAPRASVARMPGRAVHNRVSTPASRRRPDRVARSRCGCRCTPSRSPRRTRVSRFEKPHGTCRSRPHVHNRRRTAAPALPNVTAFEHIAHELGPAMAGKYTPTTLTRRRLRATQLTVKARRQALSAVASADTARQKPSARSTPPMWNCPDCGAPVSNRRHVRCDVCIAADPRQAPGVRGGLSLSDALGRSPGRPLTQATLWDPDLFRREILPRLADVTLAAIMEGGQFSKSYASAIKTGRFAPHPSTWPALAKLAGVALPTSPSPSDRA
jgi:hypothetical protein